MRRILLTIGVMMLAVGSARAAGDVMVVFDVSNSMWGQIDRVAKYEIAREVMGDLLADWDPDTNIGLVAYGHRRSDDCSDIETIIPPGPLDADAYMDQINQLVPRGRTPLTAAVEQAAEDLSYRDNPGTVVLISDGIESCNRDPCAAANLLAQNGIDFTAHVIGFGLSADQDPETLACIADATGGLFLTADNATELTEALAQVRTAVAQAPPPEPEPAPPPEPAPQAEVQIEAPVQATVGSTFAVSWTPTIDASDFITIVPVGADEGELGNSVRASADQPAQLQAPAEPGLYEIRYVVNDGRQTAGTAEIEIVDADVMLTVPETAVAGSTLAVSWSNTIDHSDFIAIVPLGADEGELGNSIRTADHLSGELQAPAEPGLYEVRYILNEGRRTLASVQIEIVAADVTLTAPETAVAGSTFAVSWSNTIDHSDFIAIVPLGADEGELGNSIRTADTLSGRLQAPVEPGLYEVRYILNEGRRTLASVQVEIVAAEVTLTAPETAVAGATFAVSWSNTIDRRDFIAIVPLGADDGELGNSIRTADNLSGDLQAPAEPGLYEVRYILNEGRRTLASVQVEILEAEVSIEAPPVVRVTEDLRVAWSNTIDGRDFITIVPLGADEGTIGSSIRASTGSPADLQAPAEPGLYEVRYVLNEGRRTLASATVEVVAADVPINQGAELQVPDTVAPGATITVNWTGGVAGGDQRVALAMPSQPDFTWIEAQPTTEGPPLEFQAPMEPGTYEFRYLDIDNREVLSRVTFEVK